MSEISIDTYDEIYLSELREKVLSIFSKNTHDKEAILVILTPPNSSNSPYYRRLKSDIFRETNKYISSSTLFKFLHRSEDLGPLSEGKRRFKNLTIKTLNEYANSDTKRVQSSVAYNQSIGFLKIDQHFINMLNQSEHLNTLHEEFYLGLNKEHLQWYGIVNDWDVRRPILSTIKNKLLESFSKDAYGNVITVLLGRRAIGKSTALRRLAIDCYNKGVQIIWIEGLQHFYEKAQSLLSSKNKYILFIDDWERTKATNQINSSFFNLISSLQNVKAVICDSEMIGREYYEFVDIEMSYKLEQANERIISKALIYNKHWLSSYIDLAQKNDVSELNLYTILFILSLSSFENQSFSEIHKYTLSRFNNTTRKDLLQIDKLLPALSKAIYLMATLSNETNAIFSWNALMKLTTFFSGRQYSILINPLEKDKEISHLLTNYFLFKKFPWPFFDNYFITFRHDSIKNAFCIPLEHDWDGSKLSLEAMNFLSASIFSENEARSIADVLTARNEKFHEPTYISGIFKPVISFRSVRNYIEELEFFYAKASLWDERDVIAIISKLVWWRKFKIYNAIQFEQIIDHLLKLGCQSPHLHEAKKWPNDVSGLDAKSTQYIRNFVATYQFEIARHKFDK